MQLLTILGIGIALAAVLFALQNNASVTVSFLLWRFDSSLAMVLLLALAAGALIVALVSMPRAFKLRWTLARQRKEIARLKADCEARPARSPVADTGMNIPPEAAQPSKYAAGAPGNGERA
jgi:uncharacterized integral membrane protein